MDISMGNIVILTVNTGGCDQLSQLLGIASLYIDPQYDNFEVSDIKIWSEGAESPVGVLEGSVGVGIVSVSDEYMKKAPIRGHIFFFKQLM